MPPAGRGLAWQSAALAEAARGNAIQTVQEALGALAGALSRGRSADGREAHSGARGAIPAHARMGAAGTCRRRTAPRGSSSSIRIRPRRRNWRSAGKNFVVVTPTASGKTLCYNLPVLNAVLENRGHARAVSLPYQGAGAGSARRAARSGRSASIDRFGVFTYDGDTPCDARKAIRERGPHRALRIRTCCTRASCRTTRAGTRLFENLRYIVLDELHTYRGVFGSHLANVLRRLRRIARFYGSEPQFICCSATIANPGELAARLIGNGMSR